MVTTDFIQITGLEIFAFHGVLEEEKQNGQNFYINARLYYSMKKAADTDDLRYALNYADCCAYITDIFKKERFDLIEAVAQRVCEKLLCRYEVLEKVELELCKPSAPIGLPFENVSVNKTCQWHKAYIAVGSNMGDSRAMIEEAIAKLKSHTSIRHVKASDLIVTKPYGPVKQDDFFNGCIEIETFLLPEELLLLLHEIEAQAQRTREIHWGPRTLDLDIIFYDRLVYESDTLILPHIDMHNRKFVLAPLMQLCPNLRHPVLGLTVAQMFAAVDKKAVLFDMDGTLVDSSEGITKSAQYALKHYGIDVDDLEKLKCFIGPPLSGSFQKWYGFSKEQAIEAVDVYRQRYNKIGIFECNLYPGTISCIRELKKRGYLIGVASSKPEQSCRRILDHFGILDLFDDVAGATMDGRIETKEQVLDLVMQRWGDVEKDNMVLIGDTIFDVEGANHMGIKSIGVRFGFGDVEQMKQAGAAAICDHMLELPKLIGEVLRNESE